MAIHVLSLTMNNNNFYTFSGLARKKKKKPSSIQGEWLAIDNQKNNILASVSLAI